VESSAELLVARGVGNEAGIELDWTRTRGERLSICNQNVGNAHALEEYLGKVLTPKNSMSVDGGWSIVSNLVQSARKR
jgi:hypothetical protein